MKYLVLMAVAAVLVPLVAFGSPSGLNNIPTADTCSPNVLVLQAYSNAGTEGDSSFSVGAKYGVIKGIEVGADYQLSPEGSTGPLNLQVKGAWWTPDGNTGLCLGLAGITSDWGEHHPFPYGVVSHKFTPLDRGHIGYAPQQDAKQFFLGYDHQFPGWLFRTDFVRDTDNSVSLYSAGALIPSKWGAAEGWVSRTDGNEDDTTVFTLKLDFALDFNKQ
jgi:hypothetical protein